MHQIEAAAANWTRSMLFVPGNRPEWMKRAPDSGADAVILDVEDSVPLPEKAAARETIRAAVAGLEDADIRVYVRVNGWRTGELLQDLAAVAVPGVDGIFLAKTDGPDDVLALDLVLEELERSNGLPLGGIEIFPGPETAHGLRDFFSLCRASARVAMVAVGTNGGGDVNRALGYRWTEAGDETSYLLSKAVTDARAAGVDQILSGVITRVNDLDLLERSALKARQYGCTGFLVIHPTHVPVVNAVFSPSEEDVADALEVLSTLEAAIGSGRAAVRMGPEMIDYAHARSAQLLLERATRFGMDVGDFPRLEMT